MARVAFVVDGFNLYHSLRATERGLGVDPVRWLDLWGLCATLVSSAFGPADTLASVHYFSALAKHIERYRPEVVARHRTYIRALEHTGVQVSLADFKAKPRNLNLADCSIRLRWFRRKWQLRTRAVTVTFRTYEEKQTDVAVACKVLELLHTGACHSVAIMSGDTDIAPVIRTARRLYPAAEIVSVFPYLRHNHALERLASRTIKIGSATYSAHQLPPSIILRTGTVITKPTSW